MPQYETIVIVAPETGSGASKDVESKLKSVIKNFDGNIKLVEDWGTRRLMRPIRKSGKGQYVYINYTAQADSQKELTRVFNIDEKIWRFGNTRLPDTYDYSKAKQNFLPEPEERGRRPFKPRPPRGGGGGYGGGGYNRDRDRDGGSSGGRDSGGAPPSSGGSSSAPPSGSDPSTGSSE